MIPSLEQLIDKHLALDVILEEKDVVAVRVQHSVTGKVIYIDVNGITICRVGHIKEEHFFVELTKATGGTSVIQHQIRR